MGALQHPCVPDPCTGPPLRVVWQAAHVVSDVLLNPCPPVANAGQWVG